MIKYGNRGMNFEDDINQTNAFYRENNIAVIYKKPTPIKATKVAYQSKYKKRICEGYFETPSTTDYNGVYKGKYIDFETKETMEKTSFPLANIHKHQIEHIRSILKHGAITFLLIRFVSLDKTFLYKGDDFINYIDSNERKSIPILEFLKNGYEINLRFCPRIDYLKLVDKIYFRGDENEKNKLKK